MKQKLIILFIVLLSGCKDDYTITLTKEEYSRLKGEVILEQPKKVILLDTKKTAGKIELPIYEASDGHDYFIYGQYRGSIEHYIECEKCKKGTL